MTLSEFVERTSFEPMPAEYAKIEEDYCNFNDDKDAFCNESNSASRESGV